MAHETGAMQAQSAIELKFRTYNCLKKAGFLRRAHELGGKKIGQLLKLRGFGLDCLLDLLTSLDPFISQPGVRPNGVSRLNSYQKARRETQQKSLSNQHILSLRPESETLQKEMIQEAKRLKRLWCAKAIRSDDPRLGSLLRAVDLHAANVYGMADRLVTGASGSFNSAEVTRRLRELRKRINSLCRMTLEKELMSFTAILRSERNKQIAARRFGWDGSGGGTLQSVGDTFGITRERVRQLCSRVERVLEGRKLFAPTLSRVVELISECAPGAAEEIEAKLVSEGLTKNLFRLEGIHNAAGMVGLEVPYTIAEVGGKRVVLTSEMEDSAKVILQVARRSIEHWGVATVADITAQTAERFSLPVNTGIVAHLLKGREDFQWLDEASGWFWLRSVPRNRLLNQIEKILSVAGEIEVSELRSGISRHHRMKGVAPPQRVLLELCRQTPWCKVDNKTVIADPLPNWEEVLSDTEQFMVLVLKEYGPIMQRSKFEELCLSLGMNRATFYVYLDYSPVITKYARSVYGLRGAQARPGVVESLIPRSPRGKVLLDYGWTQDGNIWAGYKLSKALISSGVFTVPAGINNLVKGQYPLKTEDGTRVGTLSIEEGRSWGLGPLFRRRGGESGDYLTVVFNLTTKEAVAYIGDTSLMDNLLSPDESLAFTG